MELVNVGQGSVDFRIMNLTKASLRYVKFDVMFKNDFGDNVVFKQFTFESIDKSEIIGTGYSATMTFNYLNPNHEYHESYELDSIIYYFNMILY